MTKSLLFMQFPFSVLDSSLPVCTHGFGPHALMCRSLSLKLSKALSSPKAIHGYHQSLEGDQLKGRAHGHAT